ncbi:MAG: hypothetical protein ACFB9N_11015 [Geitlerinemataceae cyanobacterium]
MQRSPSFGFSDGFPEAEDWPIAPKQPPEIVFADRCRDGGPQGGTLQVGLSAPNGKVVYLFFDRFLGRLCLGWDEKDVNAAYIKKGSKLEFEAFGFLEAAVENARPYTKRSICMAGVEEALAEARVYSSLPLR